jgi:hypothetical protein
VKLFLDTSVLLTASASAKGASRGILLGAAANGWVLLATPYVIEEVYRNLPEMAPEATSDWARLRPLLVVMDDVVTLDRPAVFEPAKDRPILFSALAWADVLLTLDRADFGSLMDSTFYGLRVLRPGVFLEQERAAGRIV